MVLPRKSYKAAYSPQRKRAKINLKSTISTAPRPSRFGTTESTAVNVKVCVRIRPPNEKELNSNKKLIVKRVDNRMLIFDPREEEEPFFYQGVQQSTPGYLKRANKEMQFIFDNVYGMESSNTDVFNESTKDIISSLMDGYNCSVFVYGATGAGKTYTMLGYPETPGITYLTMRELFDCIDLHRNEREFEIYVSYLEIYNENVHDLLQPSGPLHLRDDGKYGVQISGLYNKTINTAQELLDMLDKGNKNRTQHPTDANAESSRSHAVFQVHVKMRTKATNQAKIVKLSMIDLAGSERASATGCKGDRFKEGANINRSLLALGNCINQLADGAKFIPYRDSKLTRLLKDSLGGNCRTVMIANVAPTFASYEDTYNTLKYATRANKIQQRMKKNIVSCDGHVAQYIKQAEELSERVAQLEAELAKEKEKVWTIPTVIMGENNTVDMKKRHMQLETSADSYFDVLNGVLDKLRRQRGFAARAGRKRRAANALVALCSEVSDTQLREACRKDLSRLKLSSNSLIYQSEMLQNELKSSVDQLCNLENDLKLSQDEAMLENTSFEPLITGLNYKRDYIIAQAKAKHLESITNLQQDELNKLNSFVKNSLEMLKKYYLRLKSQGMFTTAMHEEYNSLIRQAKSSRAVTWEDDQEEIECDDAYFKYIVELDPKIVSDLPKVPCDGITMSPEIWSKTDIEINEPISVQEVSPINVEVAAVPKDETVILTDLDKNLNCTFTETHPLIFPEETSVITNSILKKRASPYCPKSIDPNSLNSTFVLALKPDSEPIAKKALMRPLEQKKVLFERTNVPLNDKPIVQKHKPIVNKVTPFKRPISNLSKENKSGFGSSSDRFHQLTTTAVNVQVGYKSVRAKERSALVSNALPYIRPTSSKR